MDRAGYPVGNFGVTGAAGFRHSVGVGGQGDISRMGFVFILCLIVPLMTGDACLLMVCVGMNGVAVDALIQGDRCRFISFTARDEREKQYEKQSSVHNQDCNRFFLKCRPGRGGYRTTG